MSSENTCEKQVHRKTKVSWGRLIHPGLVVPKTRPNGVVDGQTVNIQLPIVWRYYLLQDAHVNGPAQRWKSVFLPE